MEKTTHLLQCPFHCRMNSWPSAEARRVFAALKRIGWRHDRTVGSHKIMKKDGWADYPFSFHDSEELGPAILVNFPLVRAGNARRRGYRARDITARRMLLMRVE
jgi:predicted RNA binding protein YcfA (HicA-like mRNA interferase family)